MKEDNILIDGQTLIVVVGVFRFVADQAMRRSRRAQFTGHGV